MDREEILNASRRENKNRDLPEMEVDYRSGAAFMRVGATVCMLLLLLGLLLADTMIYSPLIIYFSILGTHWLVRFVQLKKISDLVVTILFYGLAILGTVLFVMRLMGAR